MNSFIETLNQWGGNFSSFAWPVLWQSSLLIAVVLAVDWLLARKLRAAVRYALWLVVLVKLLLPPTLALPTGVAWWLTPAKPAAPPVVSHYTVTYGETLTPPDLKFTSTPLPPPPPPKLKLAGGLLLAASAVSVALLFWMAIRWWQVTRLARQAKPYEADLESLASAQALAKLRSKVRLKIVEGRMSPAVCGLFRPVILLPRELVARLAPAQLRAVLLHELFHLRRGDVWVNCAQALLQIIYWWHPLLWLANARIRRLREEAVDDAVMLALRDEADGYVPTLLAVAKLAFRRPLLSLGLVGILESRGALRRRIERLVDFRAPRRAGLTLVSLLGIFMFSAVAVPMGEAPAAKPVKPMTLADAAAPSSEAVATFKIGTPLPMKEMVEKLLTAGITSPPTIFIYNTNGFLMLRSSVEQLTRVSRLVFKLNGLSDREINNAADDFSRTSISAPGAESDTNLFSRTFKVDASAFDRAEGNFPTSPDGGVEIKARTIFSALGVDWQAPPGKSIFFSDRLGLLFVKATTADLDVIERAISALAQPPSGHFYPAAGTNVIGVTGALEQRNDVQPLAEPEMVTKSGRSVNTISMSYISVSLPDGYPNQSIQRKTAGMYIQDRTKTNQTQPSANQLTETGKLLFEMGRLDEAATNLEAALALEPDNSLAKYYLGLADRGLAQTNGHATNKLSQAGPGRRSIISKLDHIRLDRVSFDRLPLREVLRFLAKQSKLRDPEHEGVNFLINPNPDKSGLPAPADSSEPADIGGFTVNIRNLTDVRLADVLDAVVIACDHPIKYSVQDFAVVFSPGKPATPLFTRVFAVDLQRLPPGLKPSDLTAGGGAGGNGAVLPGITGRSVSTGMSNFLSGLGVDLKTPPGKKAFYNERLSRLYVKATETDLDRIERALQTTKPSGPQIHIKARFLRVPEVWNGDWCLAGC